MIGPLPKPAAFTAGHTSRLEPKDLHSHGSNVDFDDPFEPEAEVKPFLEMHSSLFFRWISFPQATPSFSSTSPPSPIPPHQPSIAIRSPLLRRHLPSSQPHILHILTSTTDTYLVSKSNRYLELRLVTSILLLEPYPTLQGPSKTQRKRSLSISSMLQSGMLLKGVNSLIGWCRI